MSLTPIPGVTKLKAFQLGKETTFSTQVAATRRFGWRATPTIDEHITDPAADTGTLDPAIKPYRLATDYTAQTVGELYANDAPYLWSALIKAGVTPSTVGSTGKQWDYLPASTSQDNWETFIAEFYDDATADAFTFTGGVLDSLQLTFPQGTLAPIQATGNWRFAAAAAFPSTPTAGLTVDAAPTPFYAADTELFIDSTAGGIGGTKITNAMYDAAVNISNNIDVKRFANGNSTRFQAANYGRGARLMETTFTFAKTTAALAEVANWLNANPVERFISLRTTSLAFAGLGQPYLQDIRFGGYWFTRTPQDVNTNTAEQLVCHQIYDATLTYPFKVSVVNTLASL